MKHLEQLRMLNQQPLSLMQLKRLEQNQLLLESASGMYTSTCAPAGSVDLCACSSSHKRGRAAGREGGAAGNRKGGEEEREL